MTESGPPGKLAGTLLGSGDLGEDPSAVGPLAEQLPQHIGRYRIERILGQGGFGCVYLAYDEQLQRPVALKVPHARLVQRENCAALYLAEARTVANLDHPHIVPVYDVGSTDHFPCYIVSKYIPGTDLKARLNQATLTPRDVADLIATIAGALHYAHKQGLVHRDIKPGNILLDSSGVPYIADFGLALREQDVGKGYRFAGTPAYMSPEQARGEGHRVEGRSDIFSLGVVMYEMLTGRRPFKGDTEEELLADITSSEVRSPRQINEFIPKDLERICLKALSKRSLERYTTAKDMAEELRLFLSRRVEALEAATVDTSGHVVFAASHAKPVSAGFTPQASNIVSATDSQLLKIVPKGLRSFDIHDADFFLELLPGPRDRFGLPDSIRFWKARIEESDPDQSFTVGLIYGPSGCGKSSLVKAGLLPCLAQSIVTVYVEATASDTESRLLKALRRKLVDLPGNWGLVESLIALRQGQFLSSGQKVLIILDQFEQWLHAKKDESNAELIQALRHCDGAHVQCIILVRDDFWLAVSRFLGALELRLIEGQNSALVDLFDVDHARKVLAAFGRAYGRLPENPLAASNDQREFVKQAVAGLCQDGKIICVRLALFAEMLKGKPWEPTTLKAVGGTEGIGVTFLTETFSAKTAPPEHRFYQKAARQVLQFLLPEPGTNIKGHLRSDQALLEASGYKNRPQHFERLIQILDSELRLLTPTDLEESEGPEEPTTEQARPAQKHYQLTHDYLVPPLRVWLYREQRETWRGRAELLLSERAALWRTKAENRYLPVWWEWLSIRMLTRSKDWTTLQRQMMNRAGRRWAIRGSLLAICVALVLGASWEGLGRIRSQHMLDTLLHAPTEDVPAIVKNMSTYRRWLDTPLRQSLAEAERNGDARKQLHLSLALLPVDADQIEYLTERLLTGTPTEVVAIRDSVAAQADQILERLWTTLEDTTNDPHRRLRAACFLAAYEPDSLRWESLGRDVVGCLITENVFSLKEWSRALRPVNKTLLQPLANAVAETGGANELRTLTQLYGEFAADEANGYSWLEAVLLEQFDAATSSSKDGLARRQANAAASLALAGRWDQVWPLLRHTSDPTLRSCLMERLGKAEVNAHAIIERLESDPKPDASIRRALVLILGDLKDGRLQAHDSSSWVLELARNDPDAGVRSAATWLLNQSGMAPKASREKPDLVEISPGRIEVQDRFDHPQILRVEQRFALGAREVTVAEFLRFRAGHNWDKRSAPSNDCPVNEVTWYDAAAYCNWLSQEEGLSEDQWCYSPNENGEFASGMKIKANVLQRSGYRLPTGTEWEYACRAGSVTRWSSGDAGDMIDRYAWSISNSGMHSRPVAQLRPNDWGLFDMQGNAWEWCMERLDSQGLPVAVDSQQEEVVSDDTHRPLRGGTFLNDPMAVGSAAIIWNPPANRTGADSFRVARSLE